MGEDTRPYGAKLIFDTLVRTEAMVDQFEEEQQKAQETANVIAQIIEGQDEGVDLPADQVVNKLLELKGEVKALRKF